MRSCTCTHRHTHTHTYTHAHAHSLVIAFMFIHNYTMYIFVVCRMCIALREDIGGFYRLLQVYEKKYNSQLEELEIVSQSTQSGSHYMYIVIVWLCVLRPRVLFLSMGPEARTYKFNVTAIH